MADSIDFSRLDIHRKRSLPVRDFFVQFREELSLTLRTPETSLSTEIIESSLHRPGLALAGFTQVYSYQRVQILGTTEWFFLESIGSEKRREVFDRIREFRSPLWVLTHNASPHEELLEMCREQNVPVLSTARETLDFMTEVQDVLEDWFAPYCSVHASLVDVYGVGMLYIGESGVGKSECVLDLVERGHRLVADDIVNLTRKGRSIIGKGNKILGHHMEIRGIGIVDVGKLFGIRAIRNTKKVEVVVELQKWKEGETYDRTGLDPLNTEMIGTSVPKVIIPISPGKNITVISEVIAMNMLLKMNGVDAAKLFNEKLIETMKEKSRQDGLRRLGTEDVHE
ncbi:MAG: HPr kinase [Fibrobacteria bacterium]|nr:HPr kinase [Fibrobacteria bacterium]